MRTMPATPVLEFWGVGIVLMVLLVAGCEATNPLREPYSTYPSFWPVIAHLGADCSAISGVYANTGVLVPSWKGTDAGEEPITLTDLLINDYDAKARTGVKDVTLTLVTRTVEEGECAIADLRVAPSGAGVWGSWRVSCIDGDLRFTAESGAAGIPFVAVGVEASDLWFTNGVDGSLIIGIRETYTGMITVVPFYSSRQSWAKFVRVGP